MLCVVQVYALFCYSRYSCTYDDEIIITHFLKPGREYSNKTAGCIFKHGFFRHWIIHQTQNQRSVMSAVLTWPLSDALIVAF